MKVLVTCARSEIGRTVASALSARHDVTLTDLPSEPAASRRRNGRSEAGSGVIAAELGHDDATDKLAAGHQAVVHVGYGGQQGDATALLDYYSRRTYNLLLAASNAKVERCIFISTLKLLQDYEENLTVTERWRSLPPSDDPELLACHIGEIVCKEFARDRLIKVATLRLGWPIVEGSRAQAAKTGETAALATADLALALNAALIANIEQWQDIHVQSPVPNQRFLIHAAQKLLSFPEPAPQPQQAAQPPARAAARGGRR